MSDEIAFTEAVIRDGEYLAVACASSTSSVGPRIVGTRIVGTLVVEPRAGTSIYHYAEITHLQVEEAYRRRGIATRLVMLARTWAAASGYERVAVEASARPPRPAEQFYVSVGFLPRSVILDCATGLEAQHRIRR